MPFRSLIATPIGPDGNPVPDPTYDTPTCEFPLVTGATFEQPLDATQFQNHLLYYPSVVDEGQSGKSVIVDALQLQWISDMLALYAAAQLYLLSLDSSSTGNYCMHVAPFGSTYLVWPVAIAAGSTLAQCQASGGYKMVYIPPDKYAEVSSAFDAMDCVQTFIRDNFAP